MGRSFLLGRIAGIKILIHWTFLLLLGYIVFSELHKGSEAGAVVSNIGFVLALFACVVLHELGHSLMAKRFGIETRNITLLPIGGVASLERIAEDPRQELWVALAGPAVNVVIALLLYPFVASSGGLFETSLGSVTTMEGFLHALLRVNVMLVVFNAIPAFPMDGGRVLRALLALRLGRIRATSLASGLGRIIAIGFIFFGLFNNPFLVLIGIFVYFGAHTENVVTQQLELLKDYTVRNAMMTSFVTLSPTDTVKDAADKLLSGSDQDLVVVDNDQAIGVMTRLLIINSLRENRVNTPVVELMNRNFDTVQLTDPLTEVFTNALRKSGAFYPVLENNQLRGVIDMGNLNEFVTIRSTLHY